MKIPIFVLKIYRRIFILCEKLGFHILPVHYYSPIPEIGKLEDRINNVWGRVYDIIGINMNDDFQLKLLEFFQGALVMSLITFYCRIIRETVIMFIMVLLKP
jgi:hypothetical protein